MIRIATVYPADPLGTIPGGIDTLIRDIIRCAPDDFRYCLIGATTDPVSRPVRQWTQCELGNRTFDFYPVYAIKNPGQQPRFPATIRHIAPLLLNRPKQPIDILESHRIEPLLPYLRHEAPWFVFIHQHMANLESSGSDMRWKHAPSLYRRLEDWLMPKFEGVFCVHEEAVGQYRKRYPQRAQNIQFMPTWTNPDVFFPPRDPERDSLRRSLHKKYGIAADAKILMSVGRLDRQKNLERLLRAVHEIVKGGREIHSILVGDGVLRKELEDLVSELDLESHVTFAGLVANRDVANYLRGSDMMALSSDYEGMPVCAIEALACGIPVATTPVGEVDKVVRTGVNGSISPDFEVRSMAAAIVDCLDNLDRYSGLPCINAASPFTPERVLAPVFEAYRKSLR